MMKIKKIIGWTVLSIFILATIGFFIPTLKEVSFLLAGPIGGIAAGTMEEKWRQRKKRSLEKM